MHAIYGMKYPILSTEISVYVCTHICNAPHLVQNFDGHGEIYGLIT